MIIDKPRTYPLPNETQDVPYFLVGDEAFPYKNDYLQHMEEFHLSYAFN